MSESQKIPADRTLVDTQRKIVDAWLAFLKRLERIAPLATAENVAALNALIDAQLNPPEEAASVNAFGTVRSYSNQVEADGGPVYALSVSDILSLLTIQNASFQTDPATKAIALQIAGNYASITEAGARINNIGVRATADQTLSSNVIYVVPIHVPCRRRFTNFNWHFGGVGSNGNMAFAIYGDAGSRPGLSLASASYTRSGDANVDRTAAIDITLPAGPYWLAFTSDGSISMRGPNDAINCMGFDSSDRSIVGFSRSATFNGMLSDETSSQWASVNQTQAFPLLAIS